MQFIVIATCKYCGNESQEQSPFLSTGNWVCPSCKNDKFFIKGSQFDMKVKKD